MNYIDYITSNQNEVSLGKTRRILAKGGYKLVVECGNNKGAYKFKVINSKGDIKGIYPTLEDVAKRIKKKNK